MLSGENILKGQGLQPFDTFVRFSGSWMKHRIYGNNSNDDIQTTIETT